MNRCDTCIYAEYEWSELHMMNECVDCTKGYRRKFESDEDCKRYEKAGEMTESEDKG